jgi:uncharacterized protein YbbC (DUF1343 family)
MHKQVLQYGIDVLLQQPAKFQQQQIVLVTNNAATTISGEHSRVALLKNNFHLVKLFSPEHGITTIGTDGEAQPNTRDRLTGLPVISLYNKKLAPTEEELHDADIVLFDIPDVGCRFYTYLWTMTHVMEACAQMNKPFVVLDRPNPIGASVEKAEGPFLDEANCSSFIGRWNIPLKHSCTLGELALYFAATRLPQLNIEIINVKNYHRHHTALNDFAFTPTSPAIQTINTALLYPGMGLLEGVNINEARGTALPFTMFGAPWINADELLNALEIQQIPGITFETISYKAITPPYEEQMCNGLKLIIKDASQLMAVQTGLTLLKTIAALYPYQLKERLYKTNANPTGEKHLDKLLGIKDAFSQLQQPRAINTQIATEWFETIQSYLLYA